MRRAKHFRDFGRKKVLQVVSDRFANATQLLVGLVEETIREMSTKGGAARRLQEMAQIFQFFFQETAVAEQPKDSRQGDGLIQFKEHFERIGHVCLRLAFEKTLVAALAKAGGRVNDELGVGREGDAA